jgi:hypothetical protein
VGGNSNGIKPYGDMKERIPIVQAGRIFLNETNVEWHKWQHRDNAKKMLRNTLVAQTLSTAQQKKNSKVA